MSLNTLRSRKDIAQRDLSLLELRKKHHLFFTSSWHNSVFVDGTIWKRKQCNGAEKDTEGICFEWLWAVFCQMAIDSFRVLSGTV